jgi:signal transduction histidine kinase
VDLLVAVGRQIGFAIERARLHDTHARLFDAERRAREQAATILDATRDVAATLEFEDVIRQAGRWMAAALHQPSCGIWLLNEAGTSLHPAFRVSDQPEPERDERFRSLPPLAIDRLPAGFQRLMVDREAIVVDAVARGLNDVEREVQQIVPFGAYAAIPIAARDRVIGVATVVLDDVQALRPADVEVAAAIARSTALAVENARLMEQSRQLAASEERNRLARELHDSVTHALFSISLITQALPTLMERDMSRARERVERLQEVSRGALAEMRALIFQLRPAALEEHGLVLALERHTAAFESRESIAVDFHAEGNRRLPLPVEEAFYRVAQEALNNVAKHAKATSVEIRLIFTSDAATLTVRDDGIGFDPDRLPRGRHNVGLPGMCERAALVNGVATIESAPGGGATVTLTVPLTMDSKRGPVSAIDATGTGRPETR